MLGDMLINQIQLGFQPWANPIYEERWTKEDAEKLKRDLEFEFEVRRNFQVYWDDVAMFCHPDHYRLGIFPMRPGAVTEIDTMDELAEIDGSYKGEEYEEKG